MQQLGLVEQDRAAAVAIDHRRRAAEVEVDAGRAERGETAGVVGETGGIGAEQLRPHRHRAGGAAGAVELGDDAAEGARGQQRVGDADELAHRMIVVGGLGEDRAQHVVQQPFHRREQQTHGASLLGPARAGVWRVEICAGL